MDETTDNMGSAGRQITLPVRLREQGFRSSRASTDLPREVFRDGVLDLNKIPMRSVGVFAMAEFEGALKSLLPALDSAPSPETVERIRGRVLVMKPEHRAKLSIGDYVTWLRKDSAAEFEGMLREYEVLSAADVARVCDAYGAALPEIEARANAMAHYIVAMENHLPRVGQGRAPN